MRIKCQNLRKGSGLRFLRQCLVVAWCWPRRSLVMSPDTHHHLSPRRNQNWQCLLMTFPFHLSETMFSHSTADSWLIHHIASFTGRIIKFKSCSHNATFTYIQSPQITFILLGFIWNCTQIWCAKICIVFYLLVFRKDSFIKHRYLLMV